MKPVRKHPNVIIILTDDQGYGDFGCLGNDTVITPHTDALYEESIHLTDFHMAPSCAPARAGLMTGRYNDRAGVWHTVGGRSILHRDEKTMGEIFKEAGYATACFGKWHLGDNYPYRAQDRGFDEVVIHRGGGIGQAPDYWGNDYYANVFDNKGVAQRYEGYCTDVFFDLAIDFMDRHRETPFLLYLAPNAPHYPLRPPQKYLDLYPDSMPDDRARCYAMLTNIDDNLQKLRDAMDTMGIAEDTILIYATDNGGEFGMTLGEGGFVVEGHNGGMRGRKCSAYEGGHRVPCFIRYPGGNLTHCRDISQLTCNMDLIPTLMELCQIENTLGIHFDGKSLVPLLYEKEPEWPRRALIVDSQRCVEAYKWKTSSVMKDKWRLIDGKELYDLRTDPEQRNDISAEHPEIVHELREDYESWWNDVSVRINERVPIFIGSPQENPVFLSSHDWRGSEEQCVWNQGEVRRGIYHNSYLEIFVERTGWYQFDLYRWPKEANLKITEGIPGKSEGFADWYHGGRALPIVRAKIEIEGQQKEIDVKPEDTCVSFRLYLQQGDTNLQTWFFDDTGESLGAYYVYVNYLEK